MKIRPREKGSVLLIAAIMVPVVLAGLGLAIDNGAAYEAKRRLQKAVDAAAIAAAQEMRRGSPSGSYQTAALDGASRNGFSTSNSDVTVYNPPITGPRKGDPGFIEVVAHTPAPLYFMKALYDEPYKIEARAVGGATPAQMCVIALNRTASSALSVGGNANVDIPGCAVQVNSNATTAANAFGSASIKASSFDVVGGASGAGFSPQPYTNASVMDDPFASLPAPSNTGACLANNLRVNTTVTLSPGRYCNGIDIQAGAVVNLLPGTYILSGGGLNVRGGATIIGDEVTIYNTTAPYQPINFAGGCRAQLAAPRSGIYKGVLFFGDRNVSGSGKTSQFTGDSASYFTGAIYFPTTPVRVIGDAGMQAQKMLLIADTVEFQGNVKVAALKPEDGAPTAMVQASLVY